MPEYDEATHPTNTAVANYNPGVPATTNPGTTQTDDASIAPARGSHRTGQPVITRRDAKLAGHTRRRYRAALAIATTIAEPGGGESFSPGTVAFAYRHAIGKANKAIRKAAGKKLTPLVSEAADLVDQAQLLAKDIREWDDAHTMPGKSGSPVTIRQARIDTRAVESRISSDQEHGRSRVHERTKGFLSVVAAALVLPELIATVVVLVAILNAPGDLLRMITAVFLPVALVSVQWICTSKSADHYNRAREHDVLDLDPRLAEQERDHGRNTAIFAGLATAALAGLMTMRLLTIIQDSGEGTPQAVLLVLVGITAVIAVPVTKWLAGYHDGSTLSRWLTDARKQISLEDVAKDVQADIATAFLSEAFRLLTVDYDLEKAALAAKVQRLLTPAHHSLELAAVMTGHHTPTRSPLATAAIATGTPDIALDDSPVRTLDEQRENLLDRPAEIEESLRSHTPTARALAYGARPNSRTVEAARVHRLALSLSAGPTTPGTGLRVQVPGLQLASRTAAAPGQEKEGDTAP